MGQESGHFRCRRLALAGFKNDTIAFSMDTKHPYYQSETSNSGVQTFADGVLNGNDGYRSWMETLRLHVDIKGYRVDEDSDSAEHMDPTLVNSEKKSGSKTTKSKNKTKRL